MTSPTTLEFANAIVADAERHWLYGHPYRSEPRDRALIGIRTTRRMRGRFGTVGARSVRSRFAV